MKRKSGRKSSKKEEDSSNGVENKCEPNGEMSDYDEEESSKKRKSSKSNRKSVSFSQKKEEQQAEASDDQENGDQKEEKKSTKSGRKTSKKEEGDISQDLAGQNDADGAQEKKKSSKKLHKKGKHSEKEEVKEKKAEESEDEDEDDESQYEVEAVLDEKMIKGVRHYLIRWKGYEEESDTWEPEDTLECDRLIQEFKEKKKKRVKSKKLSKKDKKGSKADWDENEDFEVDKILEVHHRRDGKREFLVSWKGYGPADNSWEPEENMDCKDLIEKFMAKVEKAKGFEERELRINRQHVQRYTLCTPDSGRRLSKRFRGKERVQYHDAE